MVVLIKGSWRVTMADVDAAGIIYYASPLRWTEVLLGDWLEQLGHPISSMISAKEATPVVGVNVNYRSMLGLDDHCRLELSAAKIGASSFTLQCAVWGPSTDEVAVETLVTHAYVSYCRPGPGGRAAAERQSLPTWLRGALEAGYRPDNEGGTQ